MQKVTGAIALFMAFSTAAGANPVDRYHFGTIGIPVASSDEESLRYQCTAIEIHRSESEQSFWLTAAHCISRNPFKDYFIISSDDNTPIPIENVVRHDNLDLAILAIDGSTLPKDYDMPVFSHHVTGGKHNTSVTGIRVDLSNFQAISTACDLLGTIQLNQGSTQNNSAISCDHDFNKGDSGTVFLDKYGALVAILLANEMPIMKKSTKQWDAANITTRIPERMNEDIKSIANGEEVSGWTNDSLPAYIAYKFFKKRQKVKCAFKRFRSAQEASCSPQP